MRSVVSIAIAGAASLSAGLWLGGLEASPTKLEFLSVGQGDCAVFCHKGYTILIDDGPASQYADAGQRLVVPKLRGLGVDRLDAIFLSHPDMDHVGGTGAVLEAYPDAQVVMSDQFRSDPLMLTHLANWKVNPNQVVWLPERCGAKIGDFYVFIECPRMEPGAAANNGSMIVHLVDGEASAVFSGDAPAETEKSVEGVIDWRSEIMKAGHHGSKTATDESWIQAVRPSYAVISVGRGNRYGHPNREVLDRLTHDHVEILRTDQAGDVVFDLTGGRFVHAQK